MASSAEWRKREKEAWKVFHRVYLEYQKALNAENKAFRNAEAYRIQALRAEEREARDGQ